jgi:uncharacterized protein YegP (UPF0339 family)
MAGIFELKPAAAGQFLFHLKAPNGEIILSSERYVAKSGAEHGIDAVRRNARLDERFARKTSVRGEPYFVLTAANHRRIGTSEMYSSTAAMENGIASVKANAPGATLKDLTEAAGSPGTSRRRGPTGPVKVGG